MKKRSSGILHHITSLPSRFGVGDIGPEAYGFADFLSNAKQSYWQILPLNPTSPSYDNSPYRSSSSCAKNMLLISPELLVKEDLLESKDIDALPDFNAQHVEYAAVASCKMNLFAKAFERFKMRNDTCDFKKFCSEESEWLDDYALFAALKQHFQEKVWSDWPAELRDRNPDALRSTTNDLQDRISFEKFLQFVFSRQWFSLKRYCNQRGIQIIGDIPIYVEYDSVDVWKNPELFKLDIHKKPSVVAGVPPDYFSETGQLWGSPIYCWDEIKKQNFAWWIDRLNYNFQLCDVVRIDHFRGLIAYWEVPASEKTAINGRWVDVPTEQFFNCLFRRFPNLPIIAEDLGIITADVREVMHRFDFPGMKVLQFAFGDDLATNPYIPHNVVKNALIYTGTHDNNTVRGWFDNDISPDMRKKFFLYVGRELCPEDVPWEMIRLAMMSVANIAILPTQDIIGLGQEARMNVPAVQNGNWQWRLLPGQLTAEHARKLRALTELYGRS